MATEYPEGFAPTRRKAKSAKAEPLGFLADIPSSTDSLDESLLSIVRDFGDMLCASRTGTETWLAARRDVQMLSTASFAACREWNRSWVGRIGHDALERPYDGTDGVLKRIREVLTVCRRRIGTGLWFPKVRDGKVVRTTLSDFLASRMRDGTWWSPFIELDRMDVTDIPSLKARLTEDEAECAEAILKDVWWEKNYDSLVTFWKGVIALVEWRVANREALVAEKGGNLAYGSSARMLNDVAAWNRQTRSVSPWFVGPRCRAWTGYLEWIRVNRGVVVPRSTYARG